MIEKLLTVDANDNLIFDYDGVKELTDTGFVDMVISKIKGCRLKEMRLGGDRRDQFLYFTVSDSYTNLPDKYFSFAFEKETGTLLFSEQIRKGKKLVWKFVVGWKPLC